MKLIKKLLIISPILILASCGSEEQSNLFIPEIPVYKVTAEDVPIYQEFVGQVYGLKDISIRARVAGYLEQIYFNEGTQVEKGKLLYRIESQLYEQDVAAKLSALAEAKTFLANAQNELNRYIPLAEVNAVSQSDLDAAQTTYDAAISGVEAAEANLKASEINLGYTKIYSPITGIIGKTRAKVGDFVGQSPNPVILNVVSQLDEILVEFFLTEREYLKFARRYIERSEVRGDKIEVKKQDSNLQLILSDGSIHKEGGRLNFIDRGVDPTTGAVLVQASFPNPTRLIRPGQYAKVRAQTDIVENGILIPQKCAMEIQGKYSVYVINKENKVETRQIDVGARISEFWLVNSGLAPDEMIVLDALQKVKPGMEINPKETAFDSTSTGQN
jgi:membrane fusion protein (multidrug efflux system)